LGEFFIFFYPENAFLTLIPGKEMRSWFRKERRFLPRKRFLDPDLGNGDETLIQGREMRPWLGKREDFYPENASLTLIQGKKMRPWFREGRRFSHWKRFLDPDPGNIDETLIQGRDYMMIKIYHGKTG
jgi:hypothetical protein